MQLTLDIPDRLGQKLNAMPDPQRFIVTFLSECLDSGLDRDQWWSLLKNIEEIAVETGISDLAERHTISGACDESRVRGHRGADRAWQQARQMA